MSRFRAGVLFSASSQASLPIPALPVIRSAKSAAIAQLVEHIIRNDGVGGSNPSCGTILNALQPR